ncbi:hypothetical protein [Pseudomonas sp. 6D_7.1_Bac1]|uniref:hypothetical protein n=1 Tax=Pseudomonas sp. 6D_7.1_Bac1 TaxID=2971615 RepID=UPI0021C5D521|nr:hypothetical protein [Pseudomonas sp. 6D_7.1_Bac1]MCU1752882.1 hypothetical protein [Pseudomonas sp. 6D_7.1_Bac1]
MKFQDAMINKTRRFSVGQEQDSEIHYLSIPVSNHLVDYEEHYKIDKESFHRYVEGPSCAMNFIEQCRNRQMDHLLIIKPGKHRGV